MQNVANVVKFLQLLNIGTAPIVLPSILLKEQQSEANTPQYKVKIFNFMQLLFLTRTQFDKSTAQNDHERVGREGGKIVDAFHE